MRYVAKGLGFLLAAALFGMTVSCTFDLFGQILPEKYWYLPALATAAFDVGLIAWLMTLLHVVENNEQRVVAWIMLIVDFAGVGVTAISDVFFYDASRGLIEAMPIDWTRWIVLILMVVIVANVAAWMAMHVLNPKHLTNTTGIKAASPTPKPVVVREVKPRQISAPMRATTPKALPAPKSQSTDRDYIEFVAWKKSLAAKKTATTAKPAQSARAIRTAPSRVAQVAVPAAVEEIIEETIEDAVEEIDDQAEEIADDDEIEDGQEVDEVEGDDDDFDGVQDTDEIAVINVAPDEEAVPTKRPFRQRFGHAWSALTSDGTARGPKTLKKIK